MCIRFFNLNSKQTAFIFLSSFFNYNNNRMYIRKLDSESMFREEVPFFGVYSWASSASGCQKFIDTLTGEMNLRGALSHSGHSFLMFHSVDERSYDVVYGIVDLARSRENEGGIAWV